MKTLTLAEAADFLNMHRVTLQEKARAGIIPGSKPGRRWTFLEDDLVAYLRSLYPMQRQALQGDMEATQCHSTNARTRRIGGSSSATVDDAYSRLLALPRKQKPSSTTIS